MKETSEIIRFRRGRSKAWLKRGLVFFLGTLLVLSLSSTGALPEEGKRSAKSPGWWSPAEKVTNNSVYDESPSMAVGQNGVVHVAWEHWDGSDWEIYYKNDASAPGVFGPAQQVTNNNVHDFNPSLDVSGGYAHVAFESQSGPSGTGEIFYKIGRSGTWWPAQRVTSNSVSDWVPSLDISGGFAHIAFRSDSGPSGTGEIYYKIGRSGMWHPAQRVTNNSVNEWNPSLGVSGGYAHVAFPSESGPGGTTEIFYKIGRSGMWHPAQRVTNNSVADGSPSLDVSGGYAHVAFTNTSGPGATPEIYYKIGRSGKWYPAQRVTNNSVPDTLPSLDVSGGYANIAFSSWSGPGGTEEIYYKYGRSGAWSAAQQVTNNSVPDISPDMVVTDGIFVDLVFQNDIGVDSEIYYKLGFIDELL